jgi:cytochrome c-type biogenesis protein CcmF
MAPTIGFALLLLVFSISIFLPFYNFVSTNKLTAPQRLIKNSELEKISQILIVLIFFCAFFAQLCLIFSFIISDYSVANVYQNSHHLKPLIYKISGSWGNHEGSMLLLITILSGYSLAFAFLSKINLPQKLIIISSQSTIIAAFSAFTAFTSSPFTRLFPTPESGLGLNHVLQDIGLAMHPPMLYTGYIGFSLIFSFAIAALLTEKMDDIFAKHLKNWLFFSWGFLTLGIGLGSW